MRTPHRPRGFLSARYTPLVAALVCVMAPEAYAQAGPTSPFIVTNTGDNLGVNPLVGAGTGTLRQAIVDANASCQAGDQIRFAIPTGPFVIQPAGALPYVSCSPLIDGTSQGGAANSDPNGFNGTMAITIDGLIAVAYGGCGLSFGGGTGTLKGVKVQNFVYGGYTPAICGSPTVIGSVIQNNDIGIDAGSGATIGGIGAAERNMIANNTATGVMSFGSSVIIRNNLVSANGVGITLDCASSVQIRDNNHINGNASHGIWLGGSNNNTITGNSIVSNTGNGILVGGGFECSGPSNNNQIFNNTAIAFNNANGVRLDAGPSVGNSIMGNPIHSNSLKNINLNFDGGPLPNDSGDGDTGPNNLQNYPEPTAISYSAASDNTTITYTFDSASADYTIQVFENPGPGNPAGQTLVTSLTPVLVTGGPITPTFTVPGFRNNISMTATRIVTGDSSEFSPMISIPAAPPAPGVLLSRTTMDFNNVNVGSTSPEQKVSLLSSGAVPYRINGINSDPSCEGAPMCSVGDFICSTTCTPGNDYAPGTGCDFTGKFSPKSLGFASTTIYICDNTAASPHSITLSGTGVTPPPFEISPSKFDYGRVLVGQGSEATFSIINHAESEANIGPVKVSGADFALLSTTCGSTLPPVSACYATVGFLPVQPGLSTGLVEVFPTLAGGSSSSPGKVLTDGPPPSSAKADLQGTGFSAADLSLPSAIDFGTFTLGSTSPLTKTLTLKNTGNAVLTFAGVTVVGPFTLINNCPLNLAPGESCELVLEFRTTTVGEFTGTLNVVTNAILGSQAIALSARSQLVPLPVIIVTPLSIGFGNQAIGSQSPPQKVTVKNDGGAPAALGALTISPDFVMVGTSCTLTLEPGATCFADVAMRPQGFGQRSGQLLVNSNAAGSPHTVNMVGTGCRSFIFGGNRLGINFNCSP